ncbi:ATP-binding protein [Streptomyces griseoloalbus]|uniref:ATP-binding protein n=1 Tax=Streptomyces griseoloalbus TaxID=67303 RepID=UPI0033BC3F5C
MSTSRLFHPLPAATAPHSAICVMAAIPSAVPQLRAFARRTLHGWRRGERAAEALALIVTELVTNAYQHSGSSRVTVYLFSDERTVGVQVSDNGRWRDPAGEHPESADEDLHGRGLQLVEAYAETVLIQQSSTGTSVTATVADGMRSRAGATDDALHKPCHDGIGTTSGHGSDRMSQRIDALRLTELFRGLAGDPDVARVLQDLPIDDLRRISDEALRLHEMIEDRLV